MLFYNGDLEIMAKPTLFIGSSVEGLSVARAIKAELDFDMDVTVWSQGVFKLSHSPLEDLSTVLENSDFASFVFLPEDKLEIRGEEKATVRDNVVFELGLFYGKLGRDKVSYVMPRGYDLHLPSDLTGVTGGTFEYPNTNMQASVGTYCQQIREQLSSLRITFPDKGRFSDNILKNNTHEVYGKHISCKASIPKNKTLIIEFQRIDTEFGFNVAAMGDWFIDYELSHDRTTFAKIVGPAESEMCLSIQKGGSVIIKAYENDTSNLLFTKTVKISL